MDEQQSFLNSSAMRNRHPILFGFPEGFLGDVRQPVDACQMTPRYQFLKCAGASSSQKRQNKWIQKAAVSEPQTTGPFVLVSSGALTWGRTPEQRIVGSIRCLRGIIQTWHPGG